MIKWTRRRKTALWSVDWTVCCMSHAGRLHRPQYAAVRSDILEHVWARLPTRVFAEHGEPRVAAFGLQMHHTRNFEFSTDPLFIGRVRDFVGLYLNLPDKVLVLCVDEKSGIQVRPDRKQPIPCRQRKRRSGNCTAATESGGANSSLEIYP
ncbi:MAG: hypothetical protein ACYDGU_11205 [Acidiferrobacterales bacterium]